MGFWVHFRDTGLCAALRAGLPESVLLPSSRVRLPTPQPCKEAGRGRGTGRSPRPQHSARCWARPSPPRSSCGVSRAQAGGARAVGIREELAASSPNFLTRWWVWGLCTHQSLALMTVCFCNKSVWRALSAQSKHVALRGGSAGRGRGVRRIGADGRLLGAPPLSTWTRAGLLPPAGLRFLSVRWDQSEDQICKTGNKVPALT